MKPFTPRHKGFDVERTDLALATVDLARANAHAQGADANAEYMDDGPEEAAARLGVEPGELAESIERALKK